jgi:hypothetical protein
MSNIDYYKEEETFTRNNFNLEEVLKFQSEFEVQVVRGEDFQYQCYIDKEVYATGLTPMYTLVIGIKAFNIHNHKNIGIQK